MLYFAYGSNLHPARLAARVGRVPVVGTGVCAGRRLAFHKVGQDGTGKCDVPRVAEARVYGALYELGPAEWRQLDGIEGLGAGYEREVVSVLTEGSEVEAGLPPIQWTVYLGGLLKFEGLPFKLH